jgi:outer membrane protein assembly factor BamD (BamD/ComL family)
MAAFLLGRASHGATAARWFETYLEEQPGGNLAREALGRLIEAYQASGSKEAAVRTARQYLKRYPTGPHAELARRAVGE